MGLVAFFLIHKLWISQQYFRKLLSVIHFHTYFTVKYILSYVWGSRNFSIPSSREYFPEPGIICFVDTFKRIKNLF